VTIRGLPAWATQGGVSKEDRSVAAAGGALVDRFDGWSVHAYRFVR
jgi:hypothetical protein